ncbi:MAG: L-rhamnose isomerase [Candidatus Aminicenantes bacterium]|nr:L-rhamnose isomerase [Candidatus Aminicenantes bacterium]
MTSALIEKKYQSAREAYAELGVDTDKALRTLAEIPLSLHCWQGDDVGGFEAAGGSLQDGGLQVTGNHPGKARTIEELRQDLDKAFSLIPGPHRLNLHAIYGDFRGRPAGRDAIEPDHFRGWVDWARNRGLKLDFNATCFAHPMAADGFTLSHCDKSVRKFWIDHVKACRRISLFMGRELKSACLHNLWIPDGSKEVPVDRIAYRDRLRESLDEIFEIDLGAAMKDSLESKLFGIGSESFVVGSHEFYLAYAIAKKKLVCLDLGHFHPTESVADKISALLPFLPGLVFHLSRGVRWDSDHVVVLDDPILAVTEEIIRCRALDKMHVALDYFDGGLNRVGAWVTGARAVQKGLLIGLLQPEERLCKAEAESDAFARLALREEAKALPFGAVWDAYCEAQGVAAGPGWIADVNGYEKGVLAARS